MLFNSYEYIFFFLPCTFVVYFYLNKKRLTEAAKCAMVLASLLYYSWWNVAYLPLILISMIVNYATGVTLSKQAQHKVVSKKAVLCAGLVFNLALLAYFKYADFLITNVNLVTGSEIPLLHLTLPLAISFFTFQQIAYLVDSYKQQTKEYDFLNYAVFVAYFPQLIAGPIVHHKEMMPQFAALRHKVIRPANIAAGMLIFSIGLFKKVVIADTFAVWATQGFDHAPQLQLVEAWVTSLSYSFQLYFDFSGYSDMAIGAALLFNISLPINFDSPYKALNIQDFWRRWHITLSRFLKDYIYIPLGGNRLGPFRTYQNLVITFLLGGIWHGAGWTFVIWGLFHGVAVAAHRAWDRAHLRMPKPIAWLITFNFVNAAWIFFRATNWHDAVKVLKGMAGLSGVALPSALQPRLNALTQYGVQFTDGLKSLGADYYTPAWIVAALALCVLYRENAMAYRDPARLRWTTLLLAVLTFAASVLSLSYVSEFLYFNF